MPFNDASKESILNSNLSLRIIGVLLEKETYPTAISEKLGITVGSLNNYLRSLENHGVIEKGTRTKAQLYKIRMEGIADLWRDLWLSNLKEKIGVWKKTNYAKYYPTLDYGKSEALVNSIFNNKYFGELLISLLETPGGFDEKDTLGRVLFDLFHKTNKAFFEVEFNQPENKNLKSTKLNDAELQRLLGDLKGFSEIEKELDREYISSMAAEAWAYRLTTANKAGRKN